MAVSSGKQHEAAKGSISCFQDLCVNRRDVSPVLCTLQFAGVESRSTNSGVLESLRLSQRFRVVAQSGYSARSVGCLIFSASSWLSFRFHLDYILLGNQSTLRSDSPRCCRGAGRNRVLDAVQRKAHLPASELKAGAEGPGSHPRSCEKTFCRFTTSYLIALFDAC